ncbi:hypothetical protein K503DRAFT_280878 [Rhizopogon vinicolor AM-OR11-026]|uniref:Uncharacterized protein n=1 Tax=Rhizopogon vinicolor AM-OR11-026 TaxID=1314800 RepID=A0A1B7MVT4_9AGAM|nr:hypothetical protein K503DRAFT_280878 [Rhizopogon vinicolor AM-OR11-026]
MNTDATTRHPTQLDNTHRLPRDFDDTRDGVHSSTVRGTHSRSTVRRRRAPARSSTSRPYAFLSRLSSLVHRSQATTDQSTELQQRQRQSITSHHSPQIVEVAAVRDKEALFVARRPERVRDMVKRIKNPTRWTRIILFICCVSLPDTNDPQS